MPVLVQVCTKEKAQYGTSSTAKIMIMKPKFLKEKTSPSPLVLWFSAWIEHLTPGQKNEYKEIEQKRCSFSLVRRPPLLRPPRYRFGLGSVLYPTVSPVARLALSLVLIFVVVRQLDNICTQTAQLPPSPSAWSQKYAPFECHLAIANDPYNSYIFHPKSQMEARQRPFMHPSCLEAHATPRHESGDRAPCKPPFTRQYPLTPATAPGSPVVTCSWVHVRTRNERWKKEGWTASAKRNGKNKEPLGRSGK